MGDRLATIDMSRKLGAVPLLGGGAWCPCNTLRPWPRPTFVAAVWQQQTWAEIWGGCAPWRVELGPHLTQCCGGRGLPSYHVASWAIQPFGHNIHCVSKNVPPLACCNFDAHEWILIFFGRNVTDKVGNQKTLYLAVVWGIVATPKPRRRRGRSLREKDIRFLIAQRTENGR